MKHSLPPLPFGKQALEPYISGETIEYHYKRHHQNYIDKLNQLISGTELEELSLEDIILQTKEGSIFNNAAQAWNHTFYWNSLSDETQEPKGAFLSAIEKSFHSLEEFKLTFSQTALGIFGSGWAWLVKDPISGLLSIEANSNAKNFIGSDKTPLFTCDVWEHAYYIDYRNERSRYMKGFWQIINWDFAEENFLNGKRTLAA